MEQETVGSITIIRGLPGSGKSTHAKKLAQSMKRPIHIEADMYFMHPRNEYVFDGTVIHKAHEWCFQTARIAAVHGYDVIVSNTFTRRKEFQPYVKLAQTIGAPWNVITCTGNFQNVHGVPIEVLENMRQRWEE